MIKKALEESPPKIFKETTKMAPKSGDGVEDVLYMSLMGYFGVKDDLSEGGRVKMKTIFSYAYDQMGGKIDDVCVYLDDLKNQLGDPMLGVSRLDQLYQYIKLSSQADKIEQGLQRMGA